MTAARIPLARAWLALWPASPTDPRERCRISDGPLTATNEAWVKARNGRTLPLHNLSTFRDALDLWGSIGRSPGWADEMAAWEELARVDWDEMARAEFEAARSRRQAITLQARDWKDAIRLLVAAGEMESSTASAVGVVVETQKRGKAA